MSGLTSNNHLVLTVEVLTSRTPPTSLLTTSNDDNTYSIKQIVQGIDFLFRELDVSCSI